jgi:hypothetical protein
MSNKENTTLEEKPHMRGAPAPDMHNFFYGGP